MVKLAGGGPLLTLASQEAPASLWHAGCLVGSTLSKVGCKGVGQGAFSARLPPGQICKHNPWCAGARELDPKACSCVICMLFPLSFDLARRHIKLLLRTGKVRETQWPAGVWQDTLQGQGCDLRQEAAVVSCQVRCVSLGSLPGCVWSPFPIAGRST